MKNISSTWKAYIFLKKNRWKKKRAIYRMGLQTILDKTITFYLLFIVGDTLSAYEKQLIWLEKQAQEHLPLIATLSPLLYIIGSFQKPGVIFTSSEYQLSFLPYAQKHLWLFAALEKVWKRFFTWSVGGALILGFTPISSSIVMSYLLLFFFVEIGMTVPQWKLYQQRWYIKVLYLIFFIALNGASLLLGHQHLIGIVLFTGIFLTNLWLIPFIFQRINWAKVTGISDFYVWNIKWIGAVSKTRFERKRSFGIFQHHPYQKKPFMYTEKCIHHRIWKIYVMNKIPLIIQLMMALIAMLVILSFFPKKAMMFIGIAVAIFAYASSAVSFFMDQFKSGIIEVLPWDLQAYKQSFFKWVIIGSFPVLFCILVYFFLHFTYWVPLQILWIVIAFIYLYQVQINQSIAILGRKNDLFVKEKWYSVAAFLLVIGSGIYPILACSALFYIYLLKQGRHAQVS